MRGYRIRDLSEIRVQEESIHEELLDREEIVHFIREQVVVLRDDLVELREEVAELRGEILQKRNYILNRGREYRLVEGIRACCVAHEILHDMLVE